jgi:cytochrome P450
MKPQSPPHTGAVTGVLELLAFLRDPGFASRRFAEMGDVFETVLAGQPQVFVRGAGPVAELMGQAAALEGWWPASVSQLLGSHSLANRNGEAHLARRRAVGRLFAAKALKGYAPGIAHLCDQVCTALPAAPQPVALAEWMRPFAFQVIAEEVLETTASSLTLLVLKLLQHPPVLAWLQEESDAVPWPHTPASRA